MRVAQRQHRQLTYDVPCGKCLACLQKKRQDWVFRLKQELRVSHSAFFVTLTYDDNHLPRDSSLNVRDPQLFLKRLRQHKDVKGLNIRYMLVGEYGSETFRPHYHAIIFNLPIFNDFRNIKLRMLIEDVWKLGGVYVVPANGATFSYVAKYVLSTQQVAHELGLPTIPLLSSRRPAIGSSFLATGVARKISQETMAYVVSDGIKMATPRFYNDKLLTDAQKRKIASEKQQYAKVNSLTPQEEEQIYYQRKKTLEKLSKSKL